MANHLEAKAEGIDEIVSKAQEAMAGGVKVERAR
jgi:hypothetical protein